MRLIVAAVVTCVLAGTSSARAQNGDAPRLFVDGTALAAVNLRSHSDILGPSASSDDLSITVPGEAVAIGTFLASNVSLRLEAAFPWAGQTRPAEEPLPVDLPSVAIREDLRLASQSVAVMLGYHTGSRGRIRLAYLGGAAFVHEQFRSRLRLSRPGLPPFVPPSIETRESRLTTYRLALAIGADLDLRLASHWSLVPQVRVVAFPGELSLRPGLGIRWTM